MSSSTVAILTPSGPLVPSRGTLPCAANQLIPKGTMVQRDSSSRAVSPGDADASGLPVFGVSCATYDNRTGSENGGGAGDIDIEIEYGVHGFAYSGSPKPGDLMYAVDNQTISPTKSSRGLAGVCTEVRDGKCFIVMGPVADGVISALATTDSDVDALTVSETSAQGCIEIPLRNWALAADGSAIPAFSNGVADGFSLVGSEAFGLRINDDSTTSFATSVGLPNDLDDEAAVVIHALVSKSGATDADDAKLTFGWFQNPADALYDASSNAGGDTDAIDGVTTAKTVKEITFSVAASAVPAAPAAITLTMVVKNGTLATDDLIIHRTWLEYTKKLLTS